MATERQIEANRRNAARSTGPRTEAGKARSRANATKHGLAAESAGVEAGLSAGFEERRASWAAEHRPVGESAEWALDRAVAASLRIERCERAMDDLTATASERARLAWDEDRAVEAATLASRLARDPVLVSRQLQLTLAGAGLLVEAWLGLIATLQTGKDWSESEASKALDLLGVAADTRSGRTPIDGPEESDAVAFRRALALEEVDRLEALCDEALSPLDEMERRQALAGDVALLSRPAKLVLRYEREAWRRYRESIREVGVPTPAPNPTPGAPPVVAPPAPIVKASPEVRERTVIDPALSLEEEEERRATLAEAAAIRLQYANWLSARGDIDDSAWLDELEARFDDPAPTPGPFDPIAEGARSIGGPVVVEPTRRAVTERTRLAGIPADRNS